MNTTEGVDRSECDSLQSNCFVLLFVTFSKLCFNFRQLFKIPFGTFGKGFRYMPSCTKFLVDRTTTFKKQSWPAH